MRRSAHSQSVRDNHSCSGLCPIFCATPLCVLTRVFLLELCNKKHRTWIRWTQQHGSCANVQLLLCLHMASLCIVTTKKFSTQILKATYLIRKVTMKPAQSTRCCVWTTRSTATHRQNIQIIIVFVFVTLHMFLSFGQAQSIQKSSFLAAKCLNTQCFLRIRIFQKG